MKRMAAVLAALGISTAAVATDSPDVTQLPEGESAYGYSLSDPYTTEEHLVVDEHLVVPSDTIVLIPLPEGEGG